jgi:hypothetical protein
VRDTPGVGDVGRSGEELPEGTALGRKLRTAVGDPVAELAEQAVTAPSTTARPSRNARELAPQLKVE